MLKRFLLFAGYQTFNYLVLVINFRFVADAHYVGAVISDVTIASVGFLAMKKVAKSDHWVDWAGWTVGGALGSVAGIYISKLMMGH